MKFTVKTGNTLLDALRDFLPQASNQTLRQMIRYSLITRNGEQVRLPKDPVKAGDKIIIEPKPEKNIWDVDGTRIGIFYHDEWLIVANKPAGILTSGESTPHAPTFHKLLEKAVREFYRKPSRLFVVHRLDREVGGLVIFTLDEKVREKLMDQWQEVEKTYLCLTKKMPEKPDGTFTSWLKDGAKQKVFSYSREIPDSKLAITHYRYVKSFGLYHLFEVRLETGRKNQIRVHMSELGCPIVGDWKYGDDKDVVRQIRLLAWKLDFRHPVTGEHLTLEAPVPQKFYHPSDTDEKYK